MLPGCSPAHGDGGRNILTLLGNLVRRWGLVWEMDWPLLLLDPLYLIFPGQNACSQDVKDGQLSDVTRHALAVKSPYNGTVSVQSTAACKYRIEHLYTVLFKKRKKELTFVFRICWYKIRLFVQWWVVHGVVQFVESACLLSRQPETSDGQVYICWSSCSSSQLLLLLTPPLCWSLFNVWINSKDHCAQVCV